MFLALEESDNCCPELGQGSTLSSHRNPKMRTLWGGPVFDSLLAQSSIAARLVWSQAARPVVDEQGPCFSKLKALTTD